jgi:predicted dithiol-disulfide oxidoreductase (DUF899 family)
LRFPGESEDYRRARDQLLADEIELRRQIEKVSAQRRQLPLGGEVPTDYEFDEWSPEAGSARTVKLSELFEGGKDTLYLYSFMIVSEEQGLPFVGPCPSCTSIIDAVDGEVPHILQRANFAVCAKAPIERFRAHAETRGWRHVRLLSSAGNTYNTDYGAEDADGFQWPLASVFVRRGGRIHHFWTSEMFFGEPDGGDQGPRHVDYMWPLWAMLDRTPEGRGDFQPSLEY